MKGTRITVLLLGAAAVSALLAGCSTTTAVPEPTSSATARSHTAADAKASASPDPEPTLSGVVATGTLTSVDGTTTGKVVLTAAGGTVTATIDGFHTTASGQLDFELSPHAATAACPADSWSFVMNAVAAEAHTWDLPSNVAGGPFQVDPRYLRSAVIHVDGSPTSSAPNGCVQPVLAVAALTWDLPTTHVGLTVTDHGTRPHATGTTTADGGTLSTYTVAPYDTLDAIRARFGLTADAFAYLNPFDADAADAGLRYGTVFNLSPANRGAPPA